MWVDATSAAGYISNPKDSQVADKIAFAVAPTGKVPNGAQLALVLGARRPGLAPRARRRRRSSWSGRPPRSTSELVAETDGWAVVPPGTRSLTYEQPEYQKAAPFAKLTLQAIQQADPIHPSAKPVPYTGIQFVAIPEFQAIGTLRRPAGRRRPGREDHRRTRRCRTRRTFAERTMKKAGYYK